ncbi:hypothetical protein BDP27DRAFT_1424736 [Rhodocollybia butyracea]|uniref:Uncharacterized protein n=1 Tax=Rhodocollybia butyracea TaxID=206335 RepID=A0A9P5PH07_9AGAR|nr:hypothetical protein BDP27DRAFT_1424736 [Rhodocollybia butyracea]
MTTMRLPLAGIFLAEQVLWACAYLPASSKHPRIPGPLIPPGLLGSRKAWQKESYRAKHHATRAAEQESSGSVVKAIVRRHVQEAGSISVDLALVPLGSGWAGLQLAARPKILSVKSVYEILGLCYIEWELDVGHTLRTPCRQRLMAYMPLPKGDTWPANKTAADAALDRLYQHAVVDLAHSDHRRGRYVTLPAGFGFGGGHVCPGNYANLPHNTQLVEDVLKDPAICQIARLVDGTCSGALWLTSRSAGLAAYFLKLHRFLANLQEKILADGPDVQRMFEGCCYATCHFNLHNAWTKDHEDFFNIIFSMCAIHASGKYDHT